jgi:hypothetical protein
MPLNLEEILALPDIGQKINYLKKGRKTELPDRCKLWDDWNPERHEIIVDKEKYPDRKVLDKESEKVFDEKTGKTYEIEAKYKTEPVNRIYSIGTRYSEHSNCFHGRHRTVYGLHSD